MPEVALAAREDLLETREPPGRPGAVDGRLAHRRLTTMSARQRTGRPAGHDRAHDAARMQDLLDRLRPGVGDEVWQIPPGTPFADLPAHWTCPNCSARSSTSWCSMTDAAACTRRPALAGRGAARRAFTPHPPARRCRTCRCSTRRSRSRRSASAPWRDHWLGVLITPWFMNLVLMPRVAAAMAADRRARDAGTTSSRPACSSSSAAATRRSATTRPVRCSRRCSSSPTSADAHDTALAALDALFDAASREAGEVALPQAPRRQPRTASAGRWSASATSCSGRRREATVGLEGELRVGLRVRDGLHRARRHHLDAARRGALAAAGPNAAPRSRAARAAAVLDLRPFAGGGQRAGLRRRGRRGARAPTGWRATRRGVAPRWCANTPGACCSTGRRRSAKTPPTTRSRQRAARSLSSCDAPGGPRASDTAHTIAIATFGVAADEWLALHIAGRVSTAGPTPGRPPRPLHAPGARRRRRQRPARARRPCSRCRRCSTASITRRGSASCRAACDADPEFARQPTWRGAPAETGALARLQSDPLIGAADAALRVARAGPLRRTPARARAAAGRPQHGAAVGVRALPSGGGIAWVENARGLLIHQVRLAQDRVRTYRIVAPTEWNFHPGGALASALLGCPAHDLEAVKRRATLLVNSLDPCVACHVEFDHA